MTGSVFVPAPWSSDFETCAGQAAVLQERVSETLVNADTCLTWRLVSSKCRQVLVPARSGR